MADEEISEDANDELIEPEPEIRSRFPEMDELQHDIARRIRDNQKFLDHFLDKDYRDEESDDDEEDDTLFEEL